MAESYSVKARLSATDSGFSSTLKSAGGAVDTLASKISKGLSFGFLAGAGQQAFSALVNGAKGLVGEINASNMAWKTFESNMGIIGASKGEIDSVKKELQSFAEQTIYKSSDMAQTYAQLAAVGTKNTTKLVKGFGGLASAAENPQQAMKTLSQQGTQMAAKPTVAWQDFKLMLEQTPAGMAAVAKHMGMTSSELVKAIQDDEIATQDFFDAIAAVGNSDGFANMATQAKSAGQAMDSLKETIGNKLTPAFEVLSSKSVSILDGIANKISGIDAQGLADRVSAVVDKVTAAFNKFKTNAAKYVEAFKSAFADVGPACMEAFTAIKDSLGELGAKFGSTESVDGFKSAMEAVANVIKSVANFATEHADAIAKLIEWLPAIAIGLKGFSIAKSVLPGVIGFGKGVANIAAKIGGGLSGKLNSVAQGQDAVGKASATSATDMLKSAGSFALMGVAVLLIAAGFALLAQAAIALAGAGGGAIAVMAGMVIALAGFMVIMAFLMKMLAPMSAQLISVGVAFLAMGAAVFLIAAGFALLAQTAIALSAAGWPAIAVMIGLIAVIALLAIGAAVLGTALTAATVGLLAFGACVLMVGAGFALMGVGAMLAAVALQMIVAVMPQLVAFGIDGAIALLALGAAFGVFAIGAGLAGAAALVLGAGLLTCGVALTVVALGALMTAGAIAVLALVLPLIAEHSTTGAMALVVLGAALAVFAAGALLAGAACIVLGAGLVLIGAALLVCAVGATLLAGAMILIGTGAILAGVGFTMLASALPLLTQNAAKNAISLGILAAALVAFGASALASSVGVFALGAALIVVGTAFITIATGALLASVAIMAVSVVLPLIAAYGTEGATALLALGAAMFVFGAGALVAGTGATVLGVALTICATAVVILSVGVLTLATAILVVASGALVAAAALGLLSLALPTLVEYGAQGATAIIALGTALLTFAAGALLAGVGAITASAGIIAFGAAMVASAVGTAAMTVALLGVSTQMKAIAKNAKSAQKSLSSMQESVSAVESGLEGMKSKAKSAIQALTSVFDNAASKVEASGQKVGKGFTNGFTNGIASVQMTALMVATSVVSVLQSTASMAYNAGAYFSKGFANGMLSQMSIIQRAANAMAAAADKAVRAKLKINSPSRVGEDTAYWYGISYVNMFNDMARMVEGAAQKMVSLPNLTMPELATAYNGEMAAEYDYYRNSEYTIEVPLAVDGKEFARATASYTQSELDKRQTRDRRKHGKV